MGPHSHFLCSFSTGFQYWCVISPQHCETSLITVLGMPFVFTQGLKSCNIKIPLGWQSPTFLYGCVGFFYGQPIMLRMCNFLKLQSCFQVFEIIYLLEQCHQTTLCFDLQYSLVQTSCTAIIPLLIMCSQGTCLFLTMLPYSHYSRFSFRRWTSKGRPHP